MTRKLERSAPSPRRSVPLLFDTVDPEHRRTMVEVAYGMSYAGLEAASTVDPRTPFRSASAYQRDHREQGRKLLDAFNRRSLRDVQLAAIVMDGTRVDDRMLIWAMGVTHDGVKIPLGVTDGWSESSEVVAAMIRSWVGERGLDVDDAVWVIDGSGALRAGIQQALHGRATIQGCRVHLQRAILRHLGKRDRDALHAEIEARLGSAWARSTYDDARAALESTARWLEEQGQNDAAATLLDGLEATLELQRVGLNHGQVGAALGTTNMIESVHTSISKWKRRVSTWQPEDGGARTRARRTVTVQPDMRKRGLAVIVALAENNWKSVASRRALEQVPLAVLTARHLGGGWTKLTDERRIVVTRLPIAPAERPRVYPAIRDLLRRADRMGMTVMLAPDALAAVARDARLAGWLAQTGFAGGVRAPRPPGEMDWARVASVDFQIDRLTLPAKDKKAAGEQVAGALGIAPGADPQIVCRGSAEALGRLGLDRGRYANLNQLTSAAQGRHARDDTQVRPATPRQLVDTAGVPTGKSVHGVVTLTWRLDPPAEAIERWLHGGAEERLQIERALAESAEAAIGRVVDLERAGVAYVVERGTRNAPALGVRGVVLGAMRGGRLISPVHESVLPRHAKLERALADGGDVAAGLLDAELLRSGPELGVGQPLPGAVWSTADYLKALGPQRGGWIAAQADKAHAKAALEDWSLTRLQEEQRKLDDPFGKLRVKGALRALTLERRKATAEARAASASGDRGTQQAIAAIDRGLVELRKSGDHPDRWMQRFAWDAIKLVALRKQLAARDAAIARDGSVMHLLEHYRTRLGGRRVQRLAEQAHERFADHAETSTDELARRRGILATGLLPAREQLDAAARHGQDPAYLDAWMERWAKPAAELVAVQAKINEHARDRAPAAAQVAAPTVAIEA